MCLRRPENGFQITPGLAFDSLFAGLLLSSVFGIVLLELGRFSAVNLTLALSVFSAVAVFFSKKVSSVSFSLKPDRRQLMLIAVLLLAAVLRYPPSNWITGGQDQGVYVNVGNNISRTGKVFIKDELLSEIGDDEEVREYYLANTYRRLRNKVSGKAEGVYTPGFYVKDAEKGIIVPQFYHMHPLWFAISRSLLGVEHTTTSLLVFSLISVVLIYRLTGLVLESSWAALAAAAFLAANPLHAYMSRLPVSEVTSGMFMLGGLYYLIRASGHKEGRAFSAFVAVLSFGCLFFTRISGFTYLPFLIVVLLLARAIDDDTARRSAVTYALFGTLAFYAYSYIHGYVFSFPYSFGVFRGKVGFDITSISPLALAFALGTLAFALAYLGGKLRTPIRACAVWLENRRKYMVLGILGLTLLLLAYRGYVFAFTDAIPDRRWQIAGTGVAALRAYNVVVLAIMMTPVAFVLSLYGMYRLLANWSSGYRRLMVGALAFYFFVIYTLVSYKTPYIYYYARYLLSEAVPLLTVCLAAGLLHIKDKMNRRALAIVVLSVLIPSLAMCLHARRVETDSTYSALREIDSVFEGNSIVFLDKDIEPPTVHLVAPLRFTFERKVVLFDREDLMAGKLDHIFGFFLRKGHRLYLVSNDEGLGGRHFALLRRLPITSGFHRGVDLKANIYGQTAQALELAKGRDQGVYKHGLIP